MRKLSGELPWESSGLVDGALVRRMVFSLPKVWVAILFAGLALLAIGLVVPRSAVFYYAGLGVVGGAAVTFVIDLLMVWRMYRQLRLELELVYSHDVKPPELRRMERGEDVRRPRTDRASPRS
jgi:hypothetical protein